MAGTGRRGSTRGVSIARLRLWLLGGVVLLVAVLAGVLGYAHHRARRLIRELPHRLGIDVKSETNGFTYSQSVKGRTLFTIHASKAIQRANGKTTLHDVAITVFGPEGSNRTDTIRGAQFEYDQPNGIIQADGEVHLDLASPAENTAARPDAKRIQVTTSGLVFRQKEATAATEQPIDIVYGDVHGSATGADFANATGVLRLHRDVRMNGQENRERFSLTASAAELNRGDNTAILHMARVDSGGSRAAGDLLTVVVAKSGNIEHLKAVGHAEIETPGGVHAAAPNMDAEMNAAGKPALVHMTGGVQMRGLASASAGGPQGVPGGPPVDGEGTGSADAVTLHFTPAGQPELADLANHVELQQPGSRSSSLRADHVIAHLAAGPGGRTLLHTADADGHAELQTTEPIATGTPATKTPGAQKPPTPGTRTTVLRAARLHAVTAEAGTARYISQIDGEGDTHIDQQDSNGDTHTSSGDALQAMLAPPGAGKSAGTLRRAAQTGHVVITQHTAATPSAAAQDSRATAARADFDGDSATLTLTGNPIVTGPGVQLAATRVVLAQTGGDAEATGDVRGTLVRTGAPTESADPVHVLADRASIRSSGASGAFADFFGTARPARMWNTDAQVDAPHIALDRATGQMTAQSAGGADVHVLLPVNAAAQVAGSAQPGTKKTAASGGFLRLSGGALRFTSATAGAPGEAEMTGGVRTVNGDSQVLSDRVVARMATQAKSATPKPGRDASPLGGRVELVDAVGHVRLQQPGRTGSGERLRYTIADGSYVLTGTPSRPPSLTDSLRGTVTGTSLIFHGADDSVEVQGEPGRRVRTETHAGDNERSR